MDRNDNIQTGDQRHSSKQKDWIVIVLPEEQHEGGQKCSEIVVPLNVLGRVKGQISKHLDNVNIQL